MAYMYVNDGKGSKINIHLMSSKEIYKVFVSRKKKQLTCKDKWIKVYPEAEIVKSDYHWEKWWKLPYQLTHEVQLQNFVYRIMHRIIPCKVYLKQIKVCQSDLCTACNEKEDILHFFYECSKVEEFWQNLFNWWEAFVPHFEIPELTEESFLLGFVDALEDISLFNYVLLYAKFYVYKRQIYHEGKMELFEFLSELKFRMRIERSCCFSDGSFDRRFSAWEDFYQCL